MKTGHGFSAVPPRTLAQLVSAAGAPASQSTSASAAGVSESTVNLPLTSPTPMDRPWTMRHWTVVRVSAPLTSAPAREAPRTV